MARLWSRRERTHQRPTWPRLTGGVPVPEVRYVFPLDARSAVSSFRATVGGRALVGEVREAAAAAAAYAAGLRAQRASGLLLAHREDVFEVALGALPLTDEEVVVELTAAVFPAGAAGGLTLDLDVTSRPGAIGALTCAAFPDALVVQPRAGDGGDGGSGGADDGATDDGNRARVSLALPAAALGSDIVIKWATANPFVPRLAVEVDPTRGGSVAVALSIVPRFDVPPTAATTEYVFVVDRSWSMGWASAGTRGAGGGIVPIDRLRDALQVFLRSLPAGDKATWFNVVSFGSTHRRLWPASRAYDEATLREASAAVEEMAGDMGGTELLAPLVEVFVLTDGQVSNTAAVLAAVATGTAAHGATELFALGIGASASRSLVGGLARVGGGTAAYIDPADTADTLAAAVVTQLTRAMTPALRPHVDYGGPGGGDAAAAAAHAEAVRLGVTYGLASAATAFVIVDARSGKAGEGGGGQAQSP
ncbi:hypothetical protein I4F81_008810 [Pyropia yezoensis]|uniref:Uncharacterized protein n=1 Tax=Pyropia yezoensis TaxID=2788 RepID=A0ACC3C854_PYRYE|nr:hypothetical protein I4F81_008810 [Neopyropia yezoensis]